MEKIKSPYFTIRQRDKTLISTKIPLGILTNISYAAVRGKSDEEGAVQRILNKKRISKIKEFTLDVGVYPGAVILNWINENNPLVKNKSSISFHNTSYSAQIIDGQHRIAGMKEAIKENEEVSSMEIPVVIYEGLKTKGCADIFVSINTEQKTAPPSLVFDLYGVADESIIDPAAVRARDISIFINEEEESPYYSEIKLPGAPTRKGGIALSTAVTAIKPMIEDKGSFEQVGIKDLESQKQILLNFFTLLKRKYSKTWHKNTNVFMYAAGFVGAIYFLKLKLIPYCGSKEDFTIEQMERIITLNEDNLIYQTDVRGLAGKKAINEVYERLVSSFAPEIKGRKKFKI